MNVIVELNLRPVDKLHYLATKTVFYIINFFNQTFTVSHLLYWATGVGS